MEIVNTGSKPAHGLQASRRGRGLAFQAAKHLRPRFSLAKGSLKKRMLRSAECCGDGSSIKYSGIVRQPETLAKSETDGTSVARRHRSKSAIRYLISNFGGEPSPLHGVSGCLCLHDYAA